MIVGDSGPVLIVTGREALILRDAIGRWRAEHERYGARQKLTAVLPLLDEWERVVAGYAASLTAMSDKGRGTSGETSNTETIDSVGTSEAAQRLGITPRHVRRLIASGDLPARTVGRTQLIPVAEVEGLKHVRSA